jgi:hypothetical protein
MYKRLFTIISTIIALASLLAQTSGGVASASGFPDPVVPDAAARPSTASPSAPQAGHLVYLPLAVNKGTGSGGGGGGGGGGGSTAQSGALWLPYTLADNSVIPTYGTSQAVDSNGGIHVAYAIYSGTNAQGEKPALYAYCADRCDQKGNWSFTTLGTDVQEVRLALDPAGHPRLLLFGPVADPVWPRMRYQYAACDSACVNSSSWTVATIATPIEPTATREYNNNRYFALDKQGRPAFIYTDTNQNNHPGTFYMSCQTNCVDVSQWTETTLTTGALFDKPSLAFSPTGQPRLAFGLFDEQDNLLLAYAQCDSQCTDGANWSGVVLSTIHGTAMFSLQVDSSGIPRMGFYSGSYGYQPFESQVLYYLWCDFGCTTSAENWYLSSLGLPSGTGDGIDFVMDASNHPRMSFENAGQGLGYAWCDSNCESGSAAWQSREIESQAALADNYEVLPVHRCSVSTWFNGQRTSLALDPAGNPRISYDAQHWWYGVEYINGVPKPCNYQDVTVTRVALLDQP